MNKRTRDVDAAAAHITTMANSLLLLSASANGDRVFTCKTCNKQFPSFQALGGHRASHKKPRLAVADGGDPSSQSPSPVKPKTHECSICGMEFQNGQALGGHMRRHREAINVDPPMVKKVNSRRALCLDLNLTPLENKFVFGKVVPAVDCFF